MRCLALFTGGLDGQLAVRLMQQQRIEVVGLYVATPLCATDGVAAAMAADKLGIELLTVTLDRQYCGLLRRPRFGRLKSAAACVDCWIAMLNEAARVREEIRADFAISSEVIGQRPRTAVRDLEVVAHHAGLEGLLVRPLSAGLLPATLPEERGWVDRSRLLAIQGKGRKEQLLAARQLGVEAVPPPRANCPLLGDALGSRVLELLGSAEATTGWDLELAAIGRHSSGDNQTRIVVSRNSEESAALTELAIRSKNSTLLTPLGFAGPTILIVGETGENVRAKAARLARFGRLYGAELRFTATRAGQPPEVWQFALDAPEVR